MRFSQVLLVCALVFVQAASVQASTYRFGFAGEPAVLSDDSHRDGCTFDGSSCGALIRAFFDIEKKYLDGAATPQRFVLRMLWNRPVIVTTTMPGESLPYGRRFAIPG